jgi:hypothetical protein
MKKAIFPALLLLFSIAVHSHAQSYQVGTNVFSLGGGLGSSIAGSNHTGQGPLADLQWERGFWKTGSGVISLGYYQGYKAFKYVSADYWEDWDYTILGVRSAYHLTGLHLDRLDLYGGLMLSYDLANYTYNGTNYNAARPVHNKLTLSPFAGAKYFLIGGLGAFAELGYGVSYLSAGLCYRLM